MSLLGPLNGFRAPVLQTALILLPVLGTLGTVVTLYVLIRTELTHAVDINTQQDLALSRLTAAIDSIIANGRDFEKESHEKWDKVRDLLAQVKEDTAVSRASAAKTPRR